LLAAPEAELPELAEALKPAASLPWEVIARPDLGPDVGPGSTAAAWNSALAEARGDLVWPLSTQLPSLALVPTMLRCFDAPVVDLVHLPQSCAGRVISDASAARLQPGCLVAGRGWFQRLGGLDEALPATGSLRAFLGKARRRGAHAHYLPLPAIHG
jgi:hypothetical protein